MEDRHVIAEQLGGNIAMSLVAVFDGHRGAATAEYAAANMLPALQHNWNAHDPAATLSCAFVNMDEDYRRVEAAEYAARVQRMGEGNAGAPSFIKNQQALSEGWLPALRSERFHNHLAVCRIKFPMIVVLCFENSLIFSTRCKIAVEDFSIVWQDLAPGLGAQQ